MMKVTIEPSLSDDVFDVCVNGELVGEFEMLSKARMVFTDISTQDNETYDDLCDICDAAKIIYTKKY